MYSDIFYNTECCIIFSEHVYFCVKVVVQTADIADMVIISVH